MEAAAAERRREEEEEARAASQKEMGGNRNEAAAEEVEHDGDEDHEAVAAAKAGGGGQGYGQDVKVEEAAQEGAREMQGAEDEGKNSGEGSMHVELQETEEEEAGDAVKDEVMKDVEALDNLRMDGEGGSEACEASEKPEQSETGACSSRVGESANHAATGASGVPLAVNEDMAKGPERGVRGEYGAVEAVDDGGGSLARDEGRARQAKDVESMADESDEPTRVEVEQGEQERGAGDSES